MQNSNKIIALLLIIAAVALMIPYTILSIRFEYPDMLRQDTAIILNKFYSGGNTLIGIWFAFAVTGFPLIPAYIMIGQKLETKTPLARIATTIGVIGLIVQMIGLLRWTFVVPILADTFVHATDEATKAAAVVSFKAIHQFGGVILGEHLGQFFTIVWTVMITISFAQLKLTSKWVNVLGITSAFIYLLAQAELFATVIKNFPVWEMAGLIGSSLWLIWLVVVGIAFWRSSQANFTEYK